MIEWFFIMLFMFVALPFLFAFIKILPEWERGVVLTFGRFSSLRGPGINFIIPGIQKLIRVDMRINTADIPKQEVITKDNITLLVNAVVYYRVEDAAKAVIKIQDYAYAIRQYAQGALRDIIGNHELDFVLQEREKISNDIKEIVDQETDEWGIDITSVKIQEIELPAEMKRAMAKQAEAERERRARILVSQGELAASENLMKAAENLSKSKGALHLRTLQTVKEIAADPSEKVVVLLPSEVESLAAKILNSNK
ncbi:MAG: SPFH domain-containing protein [Candidatus Diapherotrites archaeon]|nr:SPFH domain-containing protein [Candidatus Diapherotrites archaeon]